MSISAELPTVAGCGTDVERAEIICAHLVNDGFCEPVQVGLLAEVYELGNESVWADVGTQHPHGILKD